MGAGCSCCTAEVEFGGDCNDVPSIAPPSSEGEVAFYSPTMTAVRRNMIVTVAKMKHGITEDAEIPETDPNDWVLEAYEIDEIEMFIDDMIVAVLRDELEALDVGRFGGDGDQLPLSSAATNGVDGTTLLVIPSAPDTPTTVAHNEDQTRSPLAEDSGSTPPTTTTARAGAKFAWHQPGNTNSGPSPALPHRANLSANSRRNPHEQDVQVSSLSSGNHTGDNHVALSTAKKYELPQPTAASYRSSRVAVDLDADEEEEQHPRRHEGTAHQQQHVELNHKKKKIKKKPLRPRKRVNDVLDYWDTPPEQANFGNVNDCHAIGTPSLANVLNLAVIRDSADQPHLMDLPLGMFDGKHSLEGYRSAMGSTVTSPTTRSSTATPMHASLQPHHTTLGPQGNTPPHVPPTHHQLGSDSSEVAVLGSSLTSPRPLAATNGVNSTSAGLSSSGVAANGGHASSQELHNTAPSEDLIEVIPPGGGEGHVETEPPESVQEAESSIATNQQQQPPVAGSSLTMAMGSKSGGAMSYKNHSTTTASAPLPVADICQLSELGSFSETNSQRSDMGRGVGGYVTATMAGAGKKHKTNHHQEEDPSQMVGGDGTRMMPVPSVTDPHVGEKSIDSTEGPASGPQPVGVTTEQHQQRRQSPPPLLPPHQIITPNNNNNRSPTNTAAVTAVSKKAPSSGAYYTSPFRQIALQKQQHNSLSSSQQYAAAQHSPSSPVVRSALCNGSFGGVVIGDGFNNNNSTLQRRGGLNESPLHHPQQQQSRMLGSLSLNISTIQWAQLIGRYRQYIKRVRQATTGAQQAARRQGGGGGVGAGPKQQLHPTQYGFEQQCQQQQCQSTQALRSPVSPTTPIKFPLSTSNSQYATAVVPPGATLPHTPNSSTPDHSSGSGDGSRVTTIPSTFSPQKHEEHQLEKEPPPVVPGGMIMDIHGQLHINPSCLPNANITLGLVLHGQSRVQTRQDLLYTMVDSMSVQNGGRNSGQSVFELAMAGVGGGSFMNDFSPLGNGGGQSGASGGGGLAFSAMFGGGSGGALSPYMTLF